MADNNDASSESTDFLLEAGVTLAVVIVLAVAVGFVSESLVLITDFDQ